MTSFITSFLDWVGDTDVPREYFDAAVFSMVAGCLSQRCYVNKRVGNLTLPVYPNLYTLLLGPSGNGKSLAASCVSRLLRRTPFDTYINLYEGKMSAPGMYEAMVATKSRPMRSFIYVINDELANDIGIGVFAEQFVKSLTRMYLGTPFTDTTVTRGAVQVKSPYCVNWLACTTIDWLQDCMNRSAILGGFFARVVVVDSAYTGKLVPPDKAVPPGWAKLDILVEQETRRLLRLGGEFTRTPEAEALELAWFKAQPALVSGDPRAPTRRRDYDLLLKYMLILSAAEGDTKVITKAHVEAAIKKVKVAGDVIPKIANFVILSPRHQLYLELEGLVEKAGSMSREDLSAQAYARGIFHDELGRLVSTWTEAGIVEVKPNGNGGLLAWKE